MKAFALACTAAVALGLGIGDAQSPPETIDVSIYSVCLTDVWIFCRNLAALPTNSDACGHTI